MASLDPDIRDPRPSVDPDDDLIAQGTIDLGLDMGDMTGFEGEDLDLPENIRRRRGRENSDQGIFSAAGFGVPSSSGFGGGALDDLQAGGIDLGMGGFDDV